MIQFGNPYPASFLEANNKLRRKFRDLDDDTIEDSIQYARIEYWTKHINEEIYDEGEALGWLLRVAHRYLYKEARRLTRYSSISDASHLSAGIDIERQLIYKEELRSLETEAAQKRTSTVIMHAIGYSLKELAKSENISLSAMKQRHVRERASIQKREPLLFH